MRFPLFAANTIFAIAIASMTPAAAPPKESEDAKQEEMKMLEGKWRVVSITTKGTTIDVLIVEFTFRGTKWVCRQKEEGGKNGTGDFEIDPKAKPKAIDLLPSQGKDKRSPGIYEINGEELRLCIPSEDAVRPLKRPESFDTKDKDAVLFVMRREKKP